MEDKVYATPIEPYGATVQIHFTYVYRKKIAVAVLTWDKDGEVIVNDVRNMEKVFPINQKKQSLIVYNCRRPSPSVRTIKTRHSITWRKWWSHPTRNTIGQRVHLKTAHLW